VHCSRRHSRRNRQARLRQGIRLRQGTRLRQGNLQCQHRATGRSQQAIGIYLASTASRPCACSGRCAIGLRLCSGRCGGARPAVAEPVIGEPTIPGQEQLLSDVGRFSYPGCQRSGRAKGATRAAGAPLRGKRGWRRLALFLCRTSSVASAYFVGTRQAYDNYNKMLSQPPRGRPTMCLPIQDPDRRSVERPAAAQSHPRRSHHAVGLSRHPQIPLLKAARGQGRQTREPWFGRWKLLDGGHDRGESQEQDQ